MLADVRESSAAGERRALGRHEYAPARTGTREGLRTRGVRGRPGSSRCGSNPTKQGALVGGAVSDRAYAVVDSPILIIEDTPPGLLVSSASVSASGIGTR